jgi:hypothetical protein
MPKVLTDDETAELVAACKDLIRGYTYGDCYEARNPYIRPYVVRGLKILAKIEGIADPLDVVIGAPAPGEFEPFKERAA